jgi:hypothetical protein
MKVSGFCICLVVASQAFRVAFIPESNNAPTRLEGRSVVHPSNILNISNITSPDHIESRKGRGGRGTGGSGGGGGGGEGDGLSRTSTSSNAGGVTSAGSGRARSFAGGRYYGGGAATPYSAGSRTPKGLVAGALILPLAMVAIMPGLWLYSTYPYYYNHPYRFYNQSATNHDDDDDVHSDKGRQSPWTQGKNETLPVMCVCQAYSVCGCDENDDLTYINNLISNGSYAGLNKTFVTVSDVNGTKTLLLNGTLDNGTTAPGGTDDDSAAMNLGNGRYAGYYAVCVMVLVGVFM